MNIPNKTNKIIPSVLDRIFILAPSIILSAITISKTNAVTTDIYISFLTVSFLKCTGRISATIAKITQLLKRLVPSIFP